MRAVSSPLFYLSGGVVRPSTRGGLFHRIHRAVCQLFGFRDYRLESVVPRASRNQLAILGPALAKREGLSKELIGAIFTRQRVEPVAKASWRGLNKLKKILPEGPFRENAARESDRSVARAKFASLGLDPELVESDIEGAMFLVKTRLIYALVGFQNSTAGGREKHALRRGPDGLMIKKEGGYVSLRSLATEFNAEFDERGITKKEDGSYWNYLSPEGLVPCNRFAEDALQPVETLSAQELATLRSHAAKYEGPLNETTLPRDCVLQLVTNPRRTLPKYLSNQDAQLPTHAYVRLIDAEGNVYSAGFRSTLEEDVAGDGSMFRSMYGTPVLLDYEEFRQHEGRIVTSLPMTADEFRHTLAKLNGWRENRLRFNIMRQNCTKVAKECLAEVGTTFNTEVALPVLIRRFCTTPQTQRAIGAVRNYRVRFRTTAVALWALRQVANFLLYVPRRGIVILLNVIAWTMGASRGTPTKDDAFELAPTHEDLRDFDVVLSSISQLPDAEATSIYHSFPFIQWQLGQASTCVHSYTGAPAINLLPDEEDEALRADLHKRFITNFSIAPPPESVATNSDL